MGNKKSFAEISLALKDEWKEREQEAKGFFRGNFQYYKAEANWAAKWQRRFSITALVCGSLAPVFVASSVSSVAFWFVPPWGVALIAIILSWAVAICEGLKTILRPEERWR